MQFDLFAFDPTDTTQTEPSEALTTAAAPVETMADVVAWCLAAGKTTYAKAVQRMGRAAFNTDLRTIPATEAELVKFMPASDDNIYPSEYVSANSYDDQRRRVQAALRGALGYHAEKKQLRARNDDWACVIATLAPFTGKGGFLAQNALFAINSLADACRKIHMVPQDLSSMERILELDATALDGGQRDTWRRAINSLTDLRTVIPGLTTLLPESLISLSFARRTHNALPDHLERDIAAFVEKASHEGYDKTSGRKLNERAQSTQAVYKAAFRHYLTTLQKAGVSVAGANSLRSLITDANAVSAVSWLDVNQDEVDSISSRTAAHYFGAIVGVAARNDIDVKDIAETINKSFYLAAGRAMAKEMCGSTLRICERVVNDKSSRHLFFSLHKLFRAKADDILALTRDVKALTKDSRREFLMFGVLAAFCAIQTEGAPERKMSVLKLRVRGKDANIWLPSTASPLWKIKLAGADTKTKNARPLTNVEREGTVTLNWYYETVRPHLEGDTPSSFMFPAPEADGHMRQQTFDSWIARGTAAMGMRMTAHKFRCVQASILLDLDWNNLVLAAHLLGNSVKTCATFYGWINEEELMARSQNARGKAKSAASEDEVTYE